MPLVPRFRPHSSPMEEFILPEFGQNETQGTSYYIQMYFVVAVVAIIVISGLLIIGKQLYERTFWLIRVQQTTSITKLVIPNSTASFIFFEGVFLFAWFSYTFYHRAIDLNQIPPDGRAYFLLFPWLPLYWGAWSGCVGCFYISPGVLNRTTSKDSRFNPKSLIPPPWILNSISIGFPLIVGITISVIGSMAGKNYRQAAQLFHPLVLELRNQEFDAQISMEQVATSLEIWFLFSQSIWWISLGFLCYFIFASVLFIFYIIASIYLISTLRDQIAVTKTPLFGGFRSLTRTSQMRPEFTTLSRVEKAAAEEETRAAQSTFFPPVKNPTARVTAAKTSTERAAVLQSALTTIVVMSASILLGILGYIATSLYILLVFYEASLISPARTASIFKAYNLMAAWLAAVFGGLAFFSIFTKTYGSFFDAKLSPLFKVAKSTRSSGAMETLQLRNQNSEQRLRSRRSGINSKEATVEMEAGALEENKRDRKDEDDIRNSAESGTQGDLSAFGGSTKSNKALLESDSHEKDETKKNIRFSQMEVVRGDFHPERSAARAESICEGRGIDSFIGEVQTSSNSSHSNHNSIQSIPGVKEFTYQRDQNQGRETMEKSQNQNLNLENGIDDGKISVSSDISSNQFQHQIWESRKWTKAEVWNEK